MPRELPIKVEGVLFLQKVSSVKYVVYFNALHRLGDH